MLTYIAVDIGGTQLRAARYPATGLKAEKITRKPTKGKSSTPLERLINLINDVWPTEGHVNAIAVAVPGPTNPYAGTVIETPNIPGWEHLPLRQILSERFNTKVVLGNDANLAALAEWRYGAGQGHHDLVFLTVSTGIGSGIIINDQLLLGARGLAGEIGHIRVVEGGAACGCGQTGHLETVASGPAMLRWVNEQIGLGIPSVLAVQNPLTGAMITQAAEAGDALAISALKRTGTYMGVALASILHIFNPTAVIIGGGVSRSGHFFFDPLREALRESIMAPDFLTDLTIDVATFGDDAGLIGALALARESAPA